MLALDIGSSAVRAALYDSRARALRASEARHAYRTRSAADGASEVDADQLIRVTARCIDETLAAAPARRRIAGVGVSTFWHGLVAADERGRTLTPLYLWSDRRAGTAVPGLTRHIDAEAVRRRTGCSLHSSYWPAKLEWLRGTRPELWRKGVRWMSFGDLFYARLFGSFATSLSMASGTGLFRLDRDEWDGALMRELKLEPAMLPAIAESESGPAAAYARRWPLLAGVPWFHALGDGALANLGSGALDARHRSVTIGTSAAVRVLQRAPAKTQVPPGLWRYRLDDRRVITGAALSSGGNVREWLQRSLHVDASQLERTLRFEPPASHGLTALPYLAGERSPGYAETATGAIRGLTLATTPMQVARAGIEAVTIDLARVNRLLDESAPRAQALVASGGALNASPAWMQLLADATGTPVVSSRAREASSRGAALFALERLGLAEPASLDPGVSRTFRPRRAATAAFMQAAERQAALYREVVTKRV